MRLDKIDIVTLCAGLMLGIFIFLLGPLGVYSLHADTLEDSIIVFDDDSRLKLQPQDLHVITNGMPIISFYVDENCNVISIKIHAPDSGFYSEDGETFYFYINGVKVEGTEFKCETKN